MNPRMSRGDKPLEEWMRLVRFAVEFGMELTGDEEGMFCQFDYFDQFTVWRVTAETKAGFFKLFAVGVVEFVPMTMTFVYDKCPIETGGSGADRELAGLRAQAHCAAFLGDACLFVEHRDDRMRRVGIEFG